MIEGQRSGSETRTLGRYRLLGHVGVGGMGHVYRAYDNEAGREVALKLLGTELLAGQRSVEALARFDREARAAAGLDHPGIVRILDHGEIDAQPYIAMEYVGGPSLKLVVDLPVDSVVELTVAMARAIDYAHGQGVIHRDLKPANVLLAEDGAPRVVDFGLAWMPDTTRLTRSGQPIGTPSYMAPEQVSGEFGSFGPPTDVYGIGGVLYYLLCGRPPFEGTSYASLLYQVLHKPPEPPSSHNSEVPDWLDEIVLRCLAKEPARRFASAGKLATSLAGNAPGATSGSSPGPAIVERRVILVVAASSADGPRFDGELEAIREAYSLSDTVGFAVRESLDASPDELMREIVTAQPHIVHFARGATGEGMLPALLAVPRQIECVILNHEVSAAETERLAARVRLVIQGPQAPEASAVVFSCAFYTALFAGSSYAESYRDALACSPGDDAAPRVWAAPLDLRLLPTPVAACLVRARKALDARVRRDCAYRGWEATLRIAAAARAADGAATFDPGTRPAELALLIDGPLPGGMPDALAALLGDPAPVTLAKLLARIVELGAQMADAQADGVAMSAAAEAFVAGLEWLWQAQVLLPAGSCLVFRGPDGSYRLHGRRPRVERPAVAGAPGCYLRTPAGERPLAPWIVAEEDDPAATLIFLGDGAYLDYASGRVVAAATLDAGESQALVASVTLVPLGELASSMGPLTFSEAATLILGRAPRPAGERAQAQPLKLGDPRVSRNHCLLQILPPQVCVLDLGSRNGLHVSGRHVPAGASAELADGDVLRVGRCELSVHVAVVDDAEGDVRTELATMASTAFTRESELERTRGWSTYEARHPGTGQRVQLRETSSELSLSPRRVRQLARRLGGVAALRHANIHSLLSFSCATNRISLVTEDLVGLQLADEIRLRGVLPLGEALELARCLLDAVRQAHTCGVLHRAISPWSVYRSRRRPMLAEFTRDCLSAVGLIGSSLVTELDEQRIMYVAPEVITDFQHRSPASDVYGVAAVLFHALTGRPPFEAQAEMDPLLIVLQSPPTPLASLRPDVPEAVASAVERALSKAPEDRPAVEQLTESLQP